MTYDFDLWFEDVLHPGIGPALKSAGAVYLPPCMENPPMFVGGKLQALNIVLGMAGLEDFQRELANTIPIMIGELTLDVLRIERIIVSKEKLNREKDRLVLPVLKSVLATLRNINRNDNA